MKKILIIGFVWVEPNSSAAGSRMLQLIQLFQEKNYEIHFATTATKTNFSDTLDAYNINTQQIKLNDDSFNNYANELQPDVVLFDRFLTEEQFGWRVSESCPSALKILDTEDLHSLRKTRQEVFKKGGTFTISLLKDALITKREIASIYRCDLTLIISTFEMTLLKEEFQIDEKILSYLPFLLDRLDENYKNELSNFNERQHFVSIGNFLHEPNWDMVLYLKKEIWPLIRQKIPKAELHVYGAYTTQKVEQLHNKKEGFIVKGRAVHVAEVMQSTKVCLAPLRFGAGIKGKFIDAMQNGLPNVTTSIGAEGMGDSINWAGYIEDEPQNFANKAVELYLNESEWKKAQLKGFLLLDIKFDKEIYVNSFIAKIVTMSEQLKQYRGDNFIGELLQHHTMQSSKYLSKWIEEKNK